MRYKIILYAINNTDISELINKLNSFSVKQYFVCIDAETDNAGFKFAKMNNIGVICDIKSITEVFSSSDINRNEALLIGDTPSSYSLANNLGIDCILLSFNNTNQALTDTGCYTAFSVNKALDVIFDERTVDLHVHSTFSDGTKTPSELVKLAKEKGISAVAVTDHDTVKGVEEAVKAGCDSGVEVIPGIEFSVVEGTDLHIIGLFIDINNEMLLNTINRLTFERENRMKTMCGNLQKLGMDITYREALSVSGTKFVGRPHLAEVLRRKGYVSSVQEAFEKYIGSGKPAYCSKTELSVKEAVTAVNAAGGKAFLAHLNQTGYSTDRLSVVLEEMKSYGLFGIEGYYCEYTPQNYAEYRTLAEKLNLAFSGGSDYHGDMKPGLDMGSGYGSLSIPYFALENIKNRIK